VLEEKWIETRSPGHIAAMREFHERDERSIGEGRLIWQKSETSRNSIE
jgi:hypothetical protein